MHVFICATINCKMFIIIILNLLNFHEQTNVWWLQASICLCKYSLKRQFLYTPYSFILTMSKLYFMYFSMCPNFGLVMDREKKWLTSRLDSWDVGSAEERAEMSSTHELATTDWPVPWFLFTRSNDNIFYIHICPCSHLWVCLTPVSLYVSQLQVRYTVTLWQRWFFPVILDMCMLVAENQHCLPCNYTRQHLIRLNTRSH